MYGSYGQTHHKVEISGDVTDAGQERTTTREDKATQLLICETLSMRNSSFEN